ncbi:sensor histidine kinase [Oricola thermophila]|uniref:histidine kinase n=1 Tax=Oricola thermophila TaxID=2742145 RepID=A0A6N1VFH8_9HYPH|nr:cache domain-containing protein [Oricola thermophila]QKV19323.1 cache domain-containing protein [Oricola thermophila]
MAGAGAGRAVSVRYRLLAIALLPMLVILPLLLGVTMLRWNAKFDSVLASKVNGDLTIAHQYFARILENTGEQVDALVASARFRDTLREGGQAGLEELLERSRERMGLDFLVLADAGGAPLAATPASVSGPIDTGRPVVAAALGGAAHTAVDIFSADELATISPALAERATIDLIPTRNAVPTDRDRETRGMVVHSATPVELPDGGRGVLAGGILLNRNLEFIDTINDLVYREASLPAGSQGTATLFLDDVRISTNVRLFEGRRALGTRVSAAVRETVLEKGNVWLARAFVVNDWYISAYEPIVDSAGERVGMLYVGFLETPFVRDKQITLFTVLATFVLAVALSVPIFLRWARGIFMPLERMNATIARVEGGDLGARTQIRDGKDEISRVAFHLDDLLDRIQERDRQLREWNEELNARVDRRTAELREANRQLEAATKQLVMSEKLAAIGEITAGIAHEINNPIAVIQGNLEVLRNIVGDRAKDAETEFRLIDEQADRMNQIVTKLLQFARPEDYAGFIDRERPQAVISDCLPLVRHMLKKHEIELVREDDTESVVLANRTELQQILINLIVNAIHAMPGGGRLTIAARDAESEGKPGVAVSVSDTGTGIPPDIVERIFDPFFTTKRSEGTGLGLSITQMLVQRNHGTIAVETAANEGTTFTIWLPQAPRD